MAVDDDIEGTVFKGKTSRIGTFPKIDSQRGQRFPAQRHVRREAFRCRGVLIGVTQGQQELTAAGVIIQKLHILLQVLTDNAVIIPGDILLLFIPAMKVGKIPAVDAGDLFFLFPKFL